MSQSDIEPDIKVIGNGQEANIDHGILVALDESAEAITIVIRQMDENKLLNALAATIEALITNLDPEYLPQLRFCLATYLEVIDES